MTTRVVSCRTHTDNELLALGAVYLGRAQPRCRRPFVAQAHPLANPFRGADALERYYHWLLASPERLALAKSLAGRTLACWCCDSVPGEEDGPLNCHAEIVAQVADGVPCEHAAPKKSSDNPIFWC